jgi:hypothetical protein
VVVVVVESACAVSAFVPGCVGGISNGTMGDLLRVRRRQKQSAGWQRQQAAGRRQAGGRQEWQEWQGTRRRGGGGADYTVSARRPGGGFGFSRQPRSVGAQQPEDPCNRASRIVRLARARLLDWGATGARLGRNYEAAAMADRGRRRHSQYYAPSVLHGLQWPAMACSGMQWHAATRATAPAAWQSQLLPRAIACYRLILLSVVPVMRLLPLASSPSGDL